MFTRADVEAAIYKKLLGVSLYGMDATRTREYISGYFPSGAAAFFVHLNNEWGWKGFYRDHGGPLNYKGNSRDYNYTIAKYAAGFGVGAPVGEKCDVDIEGAIIPGYFQRVVQVANKLHGEAYDKTYWHIADLRDELEYIGLGTTDIDGRNAGYLDGKMVAIDISHSGSDVDFVKSMS